MNDRHSRFRAPIADLSELGECHCGHGSRCPLPYTVMVVARRNSLQELVPCPGVRCDGAARLTEGKWHRLRIKETTDPMAKPRVPRPVEPTEPKRRGPVTHDDETRALISARVKAALAARKAARNGTKG